MSALANPIIVALDSWVQPPVFDFEYELVKYVSTTPDELVGRMRDATIVITSNTRITRDGIESAPNLKLVACNSTGTDHVDKDALRERSISLCHVPAQNTESVSEHAFALYYAVRRKILPLHDIAMEGSRWPDGQMLASMFAAPPRTNREETLVIIGYGALGKNVEKIGRALGMTVLIAERKGASTVRPARVDFLEALRQGTLFVLVAPSDASTRNMLGGPEFNLMDPSSIIVNVGRGGVVNEADLAEALKKGSIGGAAVDVFEVEPVRKESCPLLDKDIPNLVLSPHLAWFSSQTIKGTLKTVKANIEGFMSGSPQNLIYDGREHS